MNLLVWYITCYATNGHFISTGRRMEKAVCISGAEEPPFRKTFQQLDELLALAQQEGHCWEDFWVIFGQNAWQKDPQRFKFWYAMYCSKCLCIFYINWVGWSIPPKTPIPRMSTWHPGRQIAALHNSTKMGRRVNEPTRMLRLKPQFQVAF